MKITPHPLFIVLGIAAAVFGGLTTYLIYALTALIHECGHIFYLSQIGYRCEKIRLMPYGAAAICDIEGIRAADEIKLALSGPAINALLCVACAGLWWFYPATYGYTDVLFSANVVILAVNLLPAYPLDGGRVLYALLGCVMLKKKVNTVLRAVSGVTALLLVVLFFLVIKNLSMLIFAAFLFCSVFADDGRLVAVGFRAKKLKRGRQVRQIMLDKSSTFKDALRYVDDRRYCIFCSFSNGMLDEMTEEELFEALEGNSIYDRVFKE